MPSMRPHSNGAKDAANELVASSSRNFSLISPKFFDVEDMVLSYEPAICNQNGIVSAAKIVLSDMVTATLRPSPPIRTASM